MQRRRERQWRFVRSAGAAAAAKYRTYSAQLSAAAAAAGSCHRFAIPIRPTMALLLVEGRAFRSASGETTFDDDELMMMTTTAATCTLRSSLEPFVPGVPDVS